MKRMAVFLLAGAIFAGACAGGTSAPSPAPAQTTPPAAADGEIARGQQAYSAAGCGACHGPQAQGGVMPGASKLAATTLSLDALQKQVRTPRDPAKGMPPFSPTQVSDAQLRDIYAWLKSLR